MKLLRDGFFFLLFIYLFMLKMLKDQGSLSRGATITSQNHLI